jgi:hypothetical protein
VLAPVGVREYCENVMVLAGVIECSTVVPECSEMFKVPANARENSAGVVA